MYIKIKPQSTPLLQKGRWSNGFIDCCKRQGAVCWSCKMHILDNIIYVTQI